MRLVSNCIHIRCDLASTQMCTKYNQLIESKPAKIGIIPFGYGLGRSGAKAAVHGACMDFCEEVQIICNAGCHAGETGGVS